MKLMIASDIHGSIYWCRRLIERFHEEKAARLILLGDLLYHGPRNPLPREYDTAAVYALLNGHKAVITAVRGNCDSEVDQMVLEFPIMAQNLLLFFGGREVFATHGHIYNEENLPLFAPGSVLLHGHTHVGAIEDRGGYIFLNPGSVSIPKDGVHSYMTYDCEKALLERKNMDGKTIAEMAIG